jgi:hypothetical protein
MHAEEQQSGTSDDAIPGAEGGQAPPSQPGPHLLMDGVLYADWYILYELQKELERARRHERPLSILILTPAPSLGEHPSQEALEVAAAAAMKCARPTDLVGWLPDNRILVVLPETDKDGAASAGYRWRTEMYTRTLGVGALRWLVTACANPFEYDLVDDMLRGATDLVA